MNSYNDDNASGLHLEMGGKYGLLIQNIFNQKCLQSKYVGFICFYMIFIFYFILFYFFFFAVCILIQGNVFFSLFLMKTNNTEPQNEHKI